MRSRIATLGAVVAVAALLAGCGGSSADDPGAGAAPAPGATAGATTDHDRHLPAGASYEGGTVSPVRQAPPLALRDIDGRMVDIRDLRGAPVLVTFVYATCPDVCPLIMTSLAEARRAGRGCRPSGRRCRAGRGAGPAARGSPCRPRTRPAAPRG
jgi:cytochrome oxidase Cu insertion factor (SCO1/SenC/PrrC family)